MKRYSDPAEIRRELIESGVLVPADGKIRTDADRRLDALLEAQPTLRLEARVMTRGGA